MSATPQLNQARLVDDPGIRFALATAVLVATYLVAGLAGLGHAATAVAGILLGGLATTRLSVAVTTFVGFIGWAFFTGFAENSYGQLTFAAGDLERLITFALATVVVGHLARVLVASGRSQAGRQP